MFLSFNDISFFLFFFGSFQKRFIFLSLIKELFLSLIKERKKVGGGLNSRRLKGTVIYNMTELYRYEKEFLASKFK